MAPRGISQDRLATKSTKIHKNRRSFFASFGAFCGYSISGLGGYDKSATWRFIPEILPQEGTKGARSSQSFFALSAPFCGYLHGCVQRV